MISSQLNRNTPSLQSNKSLRNNTRIIHGPLRYVVTSGVITRTRERWIPNYPPCLFGSWFSMLSRSDTFSFTSTFDMDRLGPTIRLRTSILPPQTIRIVSPFTPRMYFPCLHVSMSPLSLHVRLYLPSSSTTSTQLSYFLIFTHQELVPSETGVPCKQLKTVVKTTVFTVSPDDNRTSPISSPFDDL